MDKTTFDDLLYLFGLALPLSVFCWAVIFPAAGYLTDMDDQSIVFRVASRAGFLPAGRTARFIAAAAGLTFANSVPILYLVRPVPGPRPPHRWHLEAVHWGNCSTRSRWQSQ